MSGPDRRGAAARNAGPWPALAPPRARYEASRKPTAPSAHGEGKERSDAGGSTRETQCLGSLPSFAFVPPGRSAAAQENRAEFACPLKGQTERWAPSESSSPKRATRPRAATFILAYLIRARTTTAGSCRPAAHRDTEAWRAAGAHARVARNTAHRVSTPLHIGMRQRIDPPSQDTRRNPTQDASPARSQGLGGSQSRAFQEPALDPDCRGTCPPCRYSTVNPCS